MKSYIAVFSTLLLLFSACKSGKSGNISSTEENFSTVTASVIEASSLRSPEYLEYTGTLFSEQDVTVMPAVSGVISKIYAEEGTFVKKGGLLATLDTQEFEIGLSQAKNQFESARLAFEQSKIDFERTQKLYESKSISDAQYEGLKLKHQITENQMKMAKDGLDMANKGYNDAFIRAPFDCYVTNRLVSVGTRVNMMPPTPMFRIIDIGNLLFKLSVPASELNNFKEGEKVDILFKDINKEISEPVYKIVRDIDPRSMSSYVIIKISNKKYEHELRPGLFGIAKIYSEQFKNTYILDKKYLVSQSNGKGRVFVAENNIARSRDIEFREINSVSVRVTSGLNDKDLIITSPLNILKDGHVIRIAGK